MKYTLAITRKCDLACGYCYIGKHDAVMQVSTAKQIVDFIFKYTPDNEKIDIGFFGGEPLLEFDLLAEITDIIQSHRSFDAHRTVLSVATNGTIFSGTIADFLKEHDIVACISCDGPPFIHDASRRFKDGSGSSHIVERNIKRYLEMFPLLPVNAVYSPENYRYLPDVVDYLSSLGVRNIYLNPNISARWTEESAGGLPAVYGAIGSKYMEFYRHGTPRFINLIDNKIAVILRGGYNPLEKCRMGHGEFAFAPSGNIYPCERLIGKDDGNVHCLGNINEGYIPGKRCGSPSAVNRECGTCGVKDYCMNWCGCTNYFSTGRYDAVGPFMCASEKAAIGAAFHVLREMRDNLQDFSDHIAGSPLMNVIGEVMGASNESS